MCNRQAVIDKVAECYAIATAHYGREFTIPKISFGLRGSSAGRASPSKNHLDFNEAILDANFDAFIADTPGHEVAHLVDQEVYSSLTVTFERNGRRKRTQPHGTNWKSVMRVLGQDPARCHEYVVPESSRRRRRKSNTFSYECAGCNKTVQMGKIRHNRFQSGEASYSHCRGHKLTFTG